MEGSAASFEMPAPTIAILPFENLSGDPDQDLFTRGFVEDIAMELSRFPAIDVLHPKAVALLAQGVPVAAGGRDRGRDAEAGQPGGTGAAEHLLRGSTRRIGDGFRVAVQLVEADTERQVWAGRFDAGADTLLSVQDEIAARVAAALAIQVDGARLARARRKPLASLEVYECWLRGLECLQRGTVKDDEEARRFFERALEIDPAYARAHTGLSLSHFNEWSCQAWERWDDTERLAYEHARRAASLDEGDAVAQVVLGRIHLYRRAFDEAQHCVERAVALSGNDPHVLAHAALCQGLLGEPDTALALVSRAMRLNPQYAGWYLAAEAQALFVLGRYGEAIGAGVRIPDALVDLPAWLASAHALDGDLTRARSCLERFLAQFTDRITFGREPEPGEPLRWLLHVNPFRRDEDAARLAEGLRLAGLPADPDARRPDARPRPASASEPAAVFRREGDRWRIGFEGQAVSLSDVKGFHDLATLLARPHDEVHCLELAGRPAEPGAPHAVLDDRAKREYRARMHELQQEIDAADRAHDRARGTRAREELDALVDALSGALGLGGRSRALGSAAERARSAVTWRMRSAIRKIAAAHPQLGRHLENSVRTGTFSVYAPERPVDWSL